MSTSHNANEVARTALDLAQTLANVEDMQWQAAPSTRPSERVGGSRSDVSDPTFAIVADDRRSALRDAVKRGERALIQAQALLTAAKHNLDAAEAEYEGRWE